LFTVSEEQKGHLETTLANANVTATLIGHLTGSAGKLELRLNEHTYMAELNGYEHF
jgi:thiamine-monophosphate kinase